MLDATCVPADVTYPTDLKFLNAAREKCERVIEILHKSRGRGHKKPRTYRVKARKAYLAVAKSKRVNGSRLRKALRAQLGFVRRDLNSIDRLSQETDFRILPKRLYRDLLVISELYRQQQWMYDHRSKRIDHRPVLSGDEPDQMAGHHFFASVFQRAINSILHRIDQSFSLLGPWENPIGANCLNCSGSPN